MKYHNKMYLLPVIMTLLSFTQSSLCSSIPRVLNSDVLHKEFGDKFIYNPISKEYPPMTGITAYNNALITGPLGDILIPSTKQVIYPLVSQPQMSFDILYNRTHLPNVRDIERHDQMYSVVHSYGFMNFHFMYEIVPKIAEGISLLRSDPSIKLLVWKNDKKWIETLFDIPTSQIVLYDHHTIYSIKLVYVPSPGQTGYTNPLHFTTSQLAYSGHPSHSPYIVYVTRNNSASDRHITNEYDLLDALNKSSPYPILVFTGTENPREIISIFQGATAIIGFHGAGLANAMFSAPGTPLIEMLFTHDPHWDFRHLSEALSLTYWLVPVPQSAWIQSDVTIPVGQVVITLLTSLNIPYPCPLGFKMIGAICQGCGVGYISDGRYCLRCAPGWYASDVEANPTCHICPLNTIASSDASMCIQCPKGLSTILPGASECIDSMTAMTERDNINPISDIIRKMQPPSKVKLTSRQILTEWEWTVLGRDTAGYGVPETNSIWRSLVDVSCEYNPYVPCNQKRKMITVSFNGADYVKIASDPVGLQTFNDSVRRSVASSLAIQDRLVYITGIRPGSVIVDATILYSNAAPVLSDIKFPQDFMDTYGVTDVSINEKVENTQSIQSAEAGENNGLSDGTKLGLGLGIGLGGSLVVVGAVAFAIYRRKKQHVTPSP
jgi:hypothetical protein